RRAPRRQPRRGGGGRRAGAPGGGGGGPLIPPIARLCSATPPSRCGLLLQINYLVNRTVEDGFEWAQLARISMRTARRLIARGDGPVVTMLSAKRVGVSIGAHKRWLASRERG